MTRSLPALLLLSIFGLTIFLVFRSAASSDPADTARQFLKYVAANDWRSALRQFGDNTCHCAPKGGYLAYLRYDTAYDPNLAFLLGQNFTVGKATVRALPFNGQKYSMPWDKPEDVAVVVPVEFPDAATSPYFLPLDMAFGLETPATDLKKFDADPSHDWMRAFTLRLRPRLTADVIEKIQVPQSTESQLEDSQDSKLAVSILPAELLKYQNPKDAAPVKLNSGQVVPAVQVAGELPRLKSIKVGFKIVRAGILHRWAVKKIGILDPVVVSAGREFLLTEPPAAIPK